ncbi:MAG: hypothetical protein J0I84_07915 [Terrimonas sp.]|nr:hypothetical protein [Terrimonas sp.]OJY81543.1 MAG: hypothetical protein BGP13_20360 [Sphingobacteriales bacterium 40-81]
MNTKNLLLAGALLWFISITISACNGADKKVAPLLTDSLNSEQTIVEQPDTVLFWTINDYDKTKTLVYKDSADITEPQSVINGVNSIYPDIHLLFVKQSNDTVYAKIDSAFAFTNDMGTSGAAEYLSTVIVNLTTLNNVNFVNLDFPRGSHASPGVFNKKDYENFKIKEQ